MEINTAFVFDYCGCEVLPVYYFVVSDQY